MNMQRNSDFRILCVEDEGAIRRDIVDELRDCGFTVEEAVDGADALQAVERMHPHLIISDIQMPNMDGHALLSTLRARPDAAADIPFIFLTAFGDRESMLAGRREGADDYLVKPIDFDLLIAAAESHLVNARRRAERAAVVSGMVQAVNRIDGAVELGRVLEQAPEGSPFAIVGIDNLMELVARLGDQQADHYVRFIRTLERLHGIRVFQLAPYKFGVVGKPGGGLDTILCRLANCSIRDRTRDGQAGSGQGRTVLSCSIVTETVRSGMALARTLSEMRNAVTTLQREGGGQIMALRGSELATLQQAGAIRAELVEAIGQGQLTVRLQPKIRTRDAALVGAEVLVRWQSPRLGMLSPVTFIPILERAGLLHHVTDWVLRQAAQCQIELKRRGLPERLAINIGANEFDTDLPARLLQICADTGADPSLLELEITETTLMDDLATSGLVIDELRKQGVRIALDDFGTGYSSLSYLSGCQVDSLKIDRSFVTAIVGNPVNQKVVDGIIGLGTKLGVEVIAEGVETPEQLHWLAAHGCHAVQGFLFSEPLLPEKYYELAAGTGFSSGGAVVSDFVI